MAGSTTGSSLRRSLVIRALCYLRKHPGAVAMGVIALVSLVLALLQAIPQTVRLSYSAAEARLLTAQPVAEGLESEYYFQGRRVDTLWELDVELANTGTETLVGQGESSNILGAGITAEVPDGFRLLRVDVRRNDPRLDASIDGGNRLLLVFGQWRSGEVAELALFMEEFVSAWGTEPTIGFSPRQVVDGDVIRTSLPSAAAGTKVSLFDRFGATLRNAVCIVCSIVLAPFALLFGLFVGAVLKDYRTAAKAQSKRIAYEAAMAAWLEVHPGLDDKTVERLQRVARRPALLGLSQVVLNTPALSPDDIKTLPRPVDEPMFASHVSRTIGAICGAFLCSVFVILILELVTSI